MNFKDLVDYSEVDTSPPSSPNMGQTDLGPVPELSASSIEELAPTVKGMGSGIEGQTSQTVGVHRWTLKSKGTLDAPHVAVPTTVYSRHSVTTLGHRGLDKIFQGAYVGDQIVWEVRDIEHIRPLVLKFAAAAKKQGKKAYYFRFASHPPLLEESDEVIVVNEGPSSDSGFNTFVRSILNVVDSIPLDEIEGTRFVFDCLSELIGDCVTQIQIDVVTLGGKTFIHPLRIGGRKEMEASLAPYLIDGDKAIRVLNSSAITHVSQQSPYGKLGRTPGHDELGYWTRLFTKVKHLYEDYEEHKMANDIGPEKFLPMETSLSKLKEKMLRMLIARDDTRMLALARQYFTVHDLLRIRARMIGTGMIGGKSVGMLVARKILECSADKWKKILEPHDSFFIGSDVFYTFLVHNQLWSTHEEQRNIDVFLKDLDNAREQVMEGRFPEYLITHFRQLLDYMGTSPIIVRSSSLQEDGYGNAFAGKYDSYFIINQSHQTPAERMREFLVAVRMVYASTLSEAALRYRATRGLLQRDEQMAILVMRVSGASYSGMYMPMAAGVGLSYNPYKWSPHVEEHAGVVRLVFGLGTRAVDRSDDDYTRVVALNVPDMVPRGNDNICQSKVDCLRKEHETMYFSDIEADLRKSGFPLEWFTTTIDGREMLTFEKMLNDTDYAANMTQLLQTLESAYGTAVEVEFTVNFFDHSEYQICLVQCRPLGVRGGGQVLPDPPDVPRDDIFIEAKGPVIGTSVHARVDRIVYVDPVKYGKLHSRDQPSVGRQIEKILGLEREDLDTDMQGPMVLPTADELAKRVVVLIGPGRWGTSSAELGVQCSSTLLKYAACVVEIAELGGIQPDGSLGTHFFNEMVESNIIYAGVDPKFKQDYIDREFCAKHPNRLLEILPGTNEKWADVIHVVDGEDVKNGVLTLFGDNPKQLFYLYVEPEEGEGEGEAMEED